MQWLFWARHGLPWGPQNWNPSQHGEECLSRKGADAACLRSGKFTWRMSNFGLFRDMIRAQKIMSPPFSAGDCSLRISVYQSTVGGKEHLSLCLESKVIQVLDCKLEA